MKTMNIIKEVSYKGHTITMFEDGFHQEFVIIDNDGIKAVCQYCRCKKSY